LADPPGKDAGRGGAKRITLAPDHAQRACFLPPNLKSTLNKTPNFKQQKKRREDMQKKRNEEKQREQAARKSNTFEPQKP
jgi:hypothetical protein